MKCPRCKFVFKDPSKVKGGRAKVPKGFANKLVQAKAQATRRKKKGKKDDT